MVTDFFPEIRSADHYLYTGTETALSGGCHCRRGTCGTCMEILQYRKPSPRFPEFF